MLKLPEEALLLKRNKKFRQVFEKFIEAFGKTIDIK